jgi:hypothetical protein
MQARLRPDDGRSGSLFASGHRQLQVAEQPTLGHDLEQPSLVGLQFLIDLPVASTRMSRSNRSSKASKSVNPLLSIRVSYR